MLEKAKEWIKKSIHHLEVEFSKLQVWRANPSIVEDIYVEQYWSQTPLKNCAWLSLLDNQTISINPWDKSLVHKIAKAITEENLWLNPQTMADSIIIKIPPLTEDRRKEAVKIAKNMAEEAKVWVRTSRWDSHKSIQQAKEDKAISEDDASVFEKDLQKIIDDANKEIEEMLKKKELDIMKL